MLFEKRPTEQGIKNLLLDLKAVIKVSNKWKKRDDQEVESAD